MFTETRKKIGHENAQNSQKISCALCAFLRLFLFPNGDDRVRTDGLRSASAALSQLSYIPSTHHNGPG
jgi:hypothetical protein